MNLLQELEAYGFKLSVAQAEEGELILMVAPARALTPHQRSRITAEKWGLIKQLRDRDMYQLDLMDPGAGPTARASDPVTSKVATEMLTPERLGEIKRDVLDFFLVVERATDEELQDCLSQKHPADGTLRKRRCELVEDGLLRDSGERQTNKNKRPMVVWEVVR